MVWWNKNTSIFPNLTTTEMKWKSVMFKSDSLPLIGRVPYFSNFPNHLWLLPLYFLTILRPSESMILIFGLQEVQDSSWADIFCRQKRISTWLIIQCWGFMLVLSPVIYLVLCVIISLDQLYVFMVDVAHEIDFASA